MAGELALYVTLAPSIDFFVLDLTPIALNQSTDCLNDPIKPRRSFLSFILAMILDKCWTKTFESSTVFFKTTQIKRENSIFKALLK